jgi:Ca-activated chloride channel family protein
MWSFDFPAGLLAILAVPVMLYLAHRRRGGRLSFNISFWGAESFRFRRTGRGVLLVIARCFFWLGFAALAVALAGPVVIQKSRAYLSKGLDIIIVLDASPSMSARDVGEVSRFEAAQEVIRAFVAGRENDAIGLVTFGQEAFLRVPPTLDTAFLDETLAAARVMDHGDGTAIGTGIAVAALHLERSRAGQKVIILLTDGDNNAGDITPEQAAEVAARLGIRIYAIGIGTEGQTILEYTDPQSGRQVRGVYQGKLNEGLLRGLAAATNGRYFRSGTLGVLSTVFAEIDALERTDQDVTVFVERRARHRPFIVAGLAFVLLGVAVSKLLLGEIV